MVFSLTISWKRPLRPTVERTLKVHDSSCFQILACSSAFQPNTALRHQQPYVSAIGERFRRRRQLITVEAASGCQQPFLEKENLLLGRPEHHSDRGHRKRLAVEGPHAPEWETVCASICHSWVTMKRLKRTCGRARDYLGYCQRFAPLLHPIG